MSGIALARRLGALRGKGGGTTGEDPSATEELAIGLDAPFSPIGGGGAQPPGGSAVTRGAASREETGSGAMTREIGQFPG